MATYTFTRNVVFGADGTQNVTTADTVNYSITGGGISYGTIVHSATNCTVTVNTQAGGGGTESGTITFSSTGSYSVTWTQLDDKFDSYSVTLSGTVSSAATPPDTSVTLTTVTSARNFNPTATSAALNFSDGTQGHQYRLRTYDAGANNGTSIALTTANSSGNFAFSVSSTYLPVAEGDTKWYSLYAANPVANGGTGVFSYVSDTSVVNILNLTRRLATPTLVVSDDDAASDTVGIILNITNNSTATPDQVVLRQFKNGVLLGSQVTRTWTGNGNYSGNFTQPRNTGTDTYYYNAYLIETNSSSVPQNNVTAYSYSVSRPSGLNYQAGYKTPETSVSFSSTFNGTTHSWTVSGNNDGITRYRARSGSYTGTVVSSIITGNGTDSSVTGGAGTYYVTGYIPTTSGGDGADDNIGTYVVAATESGVITGGTTATEGDSGLSLDFTISNATTGTYNWQITRNSGTAETGGEISNATSGTFTGSSFTRNITWYNNTVVETGFQGESFTMTLRTGGTVGSGTVLDTHNFTLYDNDAGITANNVTIAAGATSHTASFTVATGGGSISARIKNSGGTVLKTFTLVSSGADTEVVSSGASGTYSIEVYNGNAWIAGATYTVSFEPITTGLTSSLESISGQSTTWSTRTINLSAYANKTARIVFHYSNGSSFTGDIQLDHIQINGNNWSFESGVDNFETTTTNTDINSYSSATFSAVATGTTAARWNRDSGGTPSGNTGRADADDGSFYLYAETSSPANVSGYGFWLRSPSIPLGSSPSLSYAEARLGAGIGTLNVFLDIAEDITAPVVNNSQTIATTASLTTSCTISLSSSGSGGTLEYNKSTTTTAPTTGWQTSATVSVTRGNSYYFWARRSATALDRTNSAIPVDYLLPDTDVSASQNLLISPTDTSATVTVQDVARSTDEVAVRVNNGSSNLATRSGNGDLTFTSSLPAVGDTSTYEFFTRRPQSTGGDGSTWYATDNIFTVEREIPPTYYVDVSAFYEAEQGFESVFITINGTGYRSSPGTALQIQPGDRVGFKDVSAAFAGTITAANFDSTHWTNTTSLTLTSSYQYKTAKTGIPVSTADEVTLTASQSGYSNQKSSYYIGESLSPDTTISLDKDVYSISTSATSHTIIISNSGSSTNASITEYRVADSTTTHESRTGHGSLTVTDVPPNPGFPKSYSIQARVSTANGGSGLWLNVPDSSYQVIASTTAASNDPTIDNYGLVIYDHQSNPVTSFTSGHTLLRKIYAGTANLSTSTTTTVNTGISGLSSSNSVILLEGTGTVAASTPDSVPTTFSGTSIVFGRAQSSASVDFTIGQYSGSTLGATETYGFLIRNGNTDIVLDENSIVYGVKEILNVATTATATYQNQYIYWVYIQLTQGAYPSASGVPIPALACTSSALLVPPRILSTLWPDGSYRYVGLVLPKNLPFSAYNVAMLVSSEITTPSYYGGTNSNYGARIFDSSGNTTWDSQWRQAVVNNVVDANQFTTGTNQNGNYDVTTGYDGVTAPVLTSATEFDFGLSTTSESKSVTGLNEMDPAYTYVMGPAVTGKVSYYMGEYTDPEFGIDGYRGGGLHTPAIRIDSTNSVTLNMFRYSEGPIPNNNTEWGARVPTSYHPQGQFILVRIV